MRFLEQSKRKILQAVCWILFLGWGIVCVFLSRQDGNDSTNVSSQLSEILLRLLGFLDRYPDKSKFHIILREFAHFFSHFLLALLGGFAFVATINDLTLAVVTSFLTTSSIAVSDELVQLIVDGRAFELADLLLNFSGVVVGTFLALAISAFFKNLYSLHS